MYLKNSSQSRAEIWSATEEDLLNRLSTLNAEMSNIQSTLRSKEAELNTNASRAQELQNENAKLKGWAQKKEERRKRLNYTLVASQMIRMVIQMSFVV